MVATLAQWHSLHQTAEIRKPVAMRFFARIEKPVMIFSVVIVRADRTWQTAFRLAKHGVIAPVRLRTFQFVPNAPSNTRSAR
jgi:hypothetical protein